MADEVLRKMERAIHEAISSSGMYALVQMADLMADLTTREERDKVVAVLARAALEALSRSDVEALLRRPTLK